MVINGVVVIGCVMWVVGGFGIVVRGGEILGWVGKLYDGLYEKVFGFFWRGLGLIFCFEMVFFFVMDKIGVIWFDECIFVYIEIFMVDILSKVMVVMEKVLGGGYILIGLFCILYSVYLIMYIGI